MLLHAPYFLIVTVLTQSSEFPTSNYDVVVPFMCFQLVNTISPT